MVRVQAMKLALGRLGWGMVIVMLMVYILYVRRKMPMDPMAMPRDPMCVY